MRYTNASKYAKNQMVDDDIFEKVKMMSRKT